MRLLNEVAVSVFPAATAEIERLAVKRWIPAEIVHVCQVNCQAHRNIMANPAGFSETAGKPDNGMVVVFAELGLHVALVANRRTLIVRIARQFDCSDKPR